MREHVVDGVRVMPGAAHLEMARAAVAAAAPAYVRDGVHLRHVTWLRPVLIGDEGIDLHIELVARDDGSIDYDIYSEAAGAGDEKRVIYSQGHAVVGPIDTMADMDLDALHAECSDRKISAEDCYARIAASGVRHGASYRAVRSLSVGAGGEGRAQVLARLELPSCASETLRDYVMHPSMMDAALQAIVGLRGEGSSNRPSLPFAVEDVRVIRPSPERGYAWMRPGPGSGKLDIEVCDEAGRPCICIRGYSTRTPVSGLSRPDTSTEAAFTGAGIEIASNQSEARAQKREPEFSSNTASQSPVQQYPIGDLLLAPVKSSAARANGRATLAWSKRGRNSCRRKQPGSRAAPKDLSECACSRTRSR